jgi:hypothetical protein
LIPVKEVVDLLEAAFENDLPVFGRGGLGRRLRRALGLGEMPNDLVDENVFDVPDDGRPVVRRDDPRVCRDTKLDAGLFADGLGGLRESFVYANGDGRNTGVFGCYAGSRTRGCAAASTGVARDDEITFELLELLRQSAYHFGVARAVGIAEFPMGNEFDVRATLQQRLLEHFERKFAVEFVIGKLADGQSVQRGGARRMRLALPGTSPEGIHDRIC